VSQTDDDEISANRDYPSLELQLGYTNESNDVSNLYNYMFSHSYEQVGKGLITYNRFF